MHKAKIYKPAKTAMQSGTRNTKSWIFEFESMDKETNPLTGWISSKDTISEVRMKFSTKELAVTYAKKNNIKYKVIKTKKRSFVKKSYADNFLK